MKAEHIDAIHALTMSDPAVRAYMHLKERDGLEWEDVLAQMVLHLAQDKAMLAERLLEAARYALFPPLIISGRPDAQAGDL